MTSQKVSSLTTTITLSDGKTFEMVSTKEDVIIPVLNAFYHNTQNELVKEKLGNLNIVKEDLPLKELCQNDNCSTTMSIIISKGDTCAKCNLKVCKSCAFSTGQHYFDKDVWFCDKCVCRNT